VNDWLQISTGLAGVVNGRKGIISVWLDPTGGNGTKRDIFVMNNAGGVDIEFELEITASNTVRLRIFDTGSVKRLDIESSTTLTPNGGWYHILISWDLTAAGSPASHLYINDVDVQNITTRTGGNDLFYAVGNGVTVDANYDGTAKLPANRFQLYINLIDYLDFSVDANRRLFTDAAGNWLSLGSRGAIPTGAVPAVYLRSDSTIPGKNHGTGGDFAVNGSYGDADPPPAKFRITASSGAYAITGAAAYFEHNFRLAGDAGSYAITGAAAYFEHNFRLAGDAGSYAISGTAAGLQAHRRLAATSGSYSVSGAAASLKYSRLPMVAGGGVYTVSGTVANLERHFPLLASAGAYAITGVSAALRKDSVVAAAAVSYTITGTNASLEYNRLFAAGAGSYVITAGDASLEHHYLLTGGAGVYSISGTDAALEVAHLLAAAAASYTISGMAVSLEKAYLVTALAGAYVISGQAAGLVGEFSKADFGNWSGTRWSGDAVATQQLDNWSGTRGKGDADSRQRFGTPVSFTRYF
jgi:hypothetical protein